MCGMGDLAVWSPNSRYLDTVLEKVLLYQTGKI